MPGSGKGGEGERRGRQASTVPWSRHADQCRFKNHRRVQTAQQSFLLAFKGLNKAVRPNFNFLCLVLKCKLISCLTWHNFGAKVNFMSF